MSVICNDITKILYSQLAIYDSHAWLLMMHQKHNVVIKHFVHIQSLNNDNAKIYAMYLALLYVLVHTFKLRITTNIHSEIMSV